MKKFDFDKPINRHNTNSYKWDSLDMENVIPLWVADMDFQTAPCIIETLKKRVEHGVFGYTRVPDAYYQATIDWFSQRHNWKFTGSDIIYTSGVVPAISAIIKALAFPGDKVIIQTPVYNCFFSSIRNNGCEPSENSLIYNGDYYTIDFDDLERRASDPKATLLLLCNPHNPSGRVWNYNELTRIYEICRRHGVTVVSDEIHCELVYPPFVYIPFCSISEEAAATSVACVSPSKAFNIAGLQIANIVCKNEEMREKIDKAININEVCDVNPFGVLATISAYTEGEPWLTELIDYLQLNYEYLVNFFQTEFPEFPVTKLEGTYLVWVDFRKSGLTSEELEEKLIREAGVWLNPGAMYGADGEGFMRINIACPRSRLKEGLERLKRGLKKDENPGAGIL
ncbi:MAG: pyridoxal phosphate-dependent aminotransferase [Muribaculaceae bacterium]|nr:pyridoxal phosphate-dependent aminotransferase [Muribaculaceae bacterium]